MPDCIFLTLKRVSPSLTSVKVSISKAISGFKDVFKHGFETTNSAPQFSLTILFTYSQTSGVATALGKTTKYNAKIAATKNTIILEIIIEILTFFDMSINPTILEKFTTFWHNIRV